MGEENRNDRFTAEQRLAIQSTGKTIVSASAGSGKTTVMIEKIIRFIQSGGNVSEILAVTFTKKAASQMKEKLRKALVEAVNAPNVTAERRAALKKQLDEVPTADISTIHSFCAKLIRTHFYAAGVDNGFRVIGGDDADGTAIKNAALDELFEECYEEKDQTFTHLLSVYWRKKSDNTLRRILLSAYEQIRSRADYREYLQASCRYDENTFAAVCADLLQILREKAAYYLRFVQDEKYYFEETGGDAQLALCNELQDALSAIVASPDYFSACALQKPAFTAKRTSKKDSAERRLHIERLAALKAKTAKIYDDELAQTKTQAEELQAFLQSGKTAAALAECLLRFDEKYEERKRERGVLDYNDLEHKALALLANEEILTETRDKYVYVFVDEYQDVNPVQEAIISRIGGKNLFLVGDVKQSIYGFRGSKSKFFVDKQNAFAAGEGSSLHMTSNFRSSDAVLDAVNVQFSLAMTTDTTNVNYAKDSYMQRGGRYALNDGRTQLHLLGEEEKAPSKTRGVYSVKNNALKQEREESLLAKTIRHIIEDERTKKWFDADTGEYRSVQYSDIAILSRKKQGRIGKTVAALAAEGIPVTAAAAVNICDFAEIKTLIDILSLVDNAQQDVPLCSALLCPMGNLNADELAEIRLAYRDEKFFRNACKRYADEKKDVLSHKLRRFYAYLQEIRLLSCVVGAGELLTKILTETRMETRLLSKENGSACLRRIHRFIEETANPEPLCVHEFLTRLRDLDYTIEYSENGGENSVKVLTMHSSKGLEYPVVILDDLSAPFRGADHDEILLEEKYGIAPRAFNEAQMLKKPTLLRRLCEYRQTESAALDDLNLYYVALTRAKYALHMVFKKPSVMQDVRYARSFADFTDFSVWEKYIVKDEIFDVPKQERTALAFNPNQEKAKEIMDAFLWQYPYTGGENLPVKSSATQLLNQAFTEENTEEETPKERRAKRLMDADMGGTNTEIGLAYHAFLERFDFARLYDETGKAVQRENLYSIVQSVYEKMQISGEIENFDLLSVEKLVDILSNPVFYCLQDKTLYKERQFLVSLSVCDTYKNCVLPKEEEIIFQGAIDLLAVDDDGAWIIDYKYSGRQAKALKEHYLPQLDLYRKTTAKILRIPIEKIRCSIVNIYLGYQVDLD